MGAEDKKSESKLGFPTHFQNCNPVNIISRRIGNLIGKRHPFRDYFIFPKKNQLLSLKKQHFTIRLNDRDLNELVSKSSENLVNQIFKVKVPLVGVLEVQISALKINELKIIDKEMNFLQMITLEIHSRSAIMPDIQGKIQISNVLSIQKLEEATAELKITDIAWIEGPTSGSGKSLGLIKKISEGLIKSTDVIENLLETKILESLTSAELEKTFLEFLKKIDFTRYHLAIQSFELKEWEMRLEDGHLILEGMIDLTITSSQSIEPEITVKGDKLSYLDSSEITISEEILNHLLSSNLDQLNELMERAHVQLSRVSVVIGDDLLIIIVLPNKLKSTIDIDFYLKFNRDTSQLQLIDSQIKSNGGLLIKTILKVFRGKIEELIEKYFPVKIPDLLNRLENGIQGLEVPYDLSLQQMLIEDIRFGSQNIDMVYRGSLVISSKGQLT